MNQSSRPVDSRLYDEEYFKQTDGANFFYKGEVAPKFAYAIQCAKIRPGERALDIGCGRGDLAIALARAGAETLGIDYSAASMKIAHETVSALPEELRKKIRLACSDAAQPGLAEGRFDAIFMTDLVEHLYPDQLASCFRNCLHALKKGGRMVVHTSPNKWYNDWGYPLWERPVNKILNALFRQNLLDRPIRTQTDIDVHVNEQTLFSLKSCLRNAGFQFEIWLGTEYVVPVKKKTPALQMLEVFRQAVCHAYPLSLIPPLSFAFCNDIWAVARKP